MRLLFTFLLLTSTSYCLDYDDEQMGAVSTNANVASLCSHSRSNPKEHIEEIEKALDESASGAGDI